MEQQIEDDEQMMHHQADGEMMDEGEENEDDMIEIDEHQL